LCSLRFALSSYYTEQKEIANAATKQKITMSNLGASAAPRAEARKIDKK
jgi:hypothetical protein